MNYKKKVKYLVARRGLFQNLPISNVTEDTSEIILWRAVIDRGVVDVLADQCSTATSEWFSVENEEFTLVCELASLEPKSVKNTVSSIRQEKIPFQKIVMLSEK